MTFVFVISLVNTWDTHHFLIALTVEVQEIRMFWTDRLPLVVLVKIGDSLPGSKDIIDGESIKLIEIEIVVNVLKSLNEQHGIFRFVLYVLGGFCWWLMCLLSFVILLYSSHRSLLSGLYWSSWPVHSVVATHGIDSLRKMH